VPDFADEVIEVNAKQPHSPPMTLGNMRDMTTDRC
jgi:hypothetical protein